MFDLFKIFVDQLKNRYILSLYRYFLFVLNYDLPNTHNSKTLYRELKVAMINNQAL